MEVKEHSLRTPKFVGVIGGAASNGQLVHAAMVTNSDAETFGLIDPNVHDGLGLVARINATIFPDLGVPHATANMPLFDTFENAVAAVEAYAAKGLKFFCGFSTDDEHNAKDWMTAELQKVRDDVAEHGALLDKLQAVAEQFPDEVGTEGQDPAASADKDPKAGNDSKN